MKWKYCLVLGLLSAAGVLTIVHSNGKTGVVETLVSIIILTALAVFE